MKFRSKKHLILLLPLFIAIFYFVYQKNSRQNRTAAMSTTIDHTKINANRLPVDIPAKDKMQAPQVSLEERQAHILNTTNDHKAGASTPSQSKLQNPPAEPNSNVSNRFTDSKFKWKVQVLDRMKIVDGKQLKIPDFVPDKIVLLEAGPGELLLSYDQVKVLSCPEVQGLDGSLVVRFDINGIVTDVEWQDQSKGPIPAFVYACRFGPVMSQDGPTNAVFVWPSDALQDFANHQRREPAGD